MSQHYRNKIHQRLRLIFGIAIYCVQLSPVAAQQHFGSITGLVTDPSAAVVPAATVVVTNENTGVKTTLKTDAGLHAENGCGDTIAWNNPLCQRIGSGGLNPQWTVISRHGEYAQNETECNIPSAITQAPGILIITTTAAAYTCGNFNADGTINTAPASWPYSTGDIQMNTFNFSPNGSGGSANCQGTCTITIVGKMPASATNLWPAFWLLGSNCQDANKWSGDTGFDGCPNLGASQYTEIDMVECYNSRGWCQFHVANPSFGIGGGCDASYPVDTNQHTFKTVWTATSVKQYMDGTLETTCNQAMTNPMFLIAQIQTGGVGRTPSNSNLPASMVINSVTITNANSNVIFSDTFPNQQTTTMQGITFSGGASPGVRGGRRLGWPQAGRMGIGKALGSPQN
jgi:hypothetical protein